MDVFGIRIPSKDIVNRDLEIAAVEVKRKAKGDLPLHYFYQALCYSKLAHRCYLACPKQSFSEKDKINAADLGVGLLKIKDKTSELVTYPRRMLPSPEQIKELLHRLHIVQCSLCGSFVYRYEKGN